VTTTAPPGLKLPFRFDPALLQRDLSLVRPDEWSPHYNDGDFGGQWTGVALRSAAGSQRDLHAGHAGQSDYLDTDLLARCAYFREILQTFPCPLKSVRLLSLAPGSFIREHSDHALGFEDGEIRIHVPIETNAGVEFYVCGEQLLMEEGGCYYVNVNLPHRVNNRGAAARVHLVIDAAVDDWVRDLFAECTGHAGEIPRSDLPPGGFDKFAGLVFADEPLREKLRAIPDRRELLRMVMWEAAQRGFDLNEADIEAVFRSTHAAEYRSNEGWLPVKISLREAQPWATWIYTAGERFAEPFFAAEVRARLFDPFTKLFSREMPIPTGPKVRPDGFIFHLSRCGSTLISRSLAAAESMLVLSEPPPVDEIVRMKNPQWLEWIVSALGRVRGPEQTRYVIKLDSWHIRSLPMFRAAFPDVPWIFVYRDPLEVLVSQLVQPGLHTSPGAMDPAILGLRAEDIVGLTRQQWCVRVIEGFLAAALEFRDDPQGMFVDYRELPDAIGGKITRHFGLELTTDDQVRVEAASRLDAKNPIAEFTSDNEAKRKQIESLGPESGLENLQALYRQIGLYPQ
jgi:hypothetical protein